MQFIRDIISRLTEAPGALEPAAIPMESPMRLDLVALEYEQVRGIYGGSKSTMPARMRWLHPDAAASFLVDLAPHVRVSDMFRSAESSLHARKTRRGSQRPAYSGHNYGLSIDLDVSWTMRNLYLSKPELDEWMAVRGWDCFRKDGKRRVEEWHYNYGTRHLIRDDERTNQHSLERRILELYGSRLVLSRRQVQERLRDLRLYGGDIDGDHGPLTQQAIKAFQRAWLLGVDGRAGPMTQRTLAYVTAVRS